MIDLSINLHSITLPSPIVGKFKEGIILKNKNLVEEVKKRAIANLGFGCVDSEKAIALRNFVIATMAEIMGASDDTEYYLATMLDEPELIGLVKHMDLENRLIVAKRGLCLDILATDLNPKVRICVAKNGNTKQVEELLEDEDSDVKKAAEERYSRLIELF